MTEQLRHIPFSPAAEEVIRWLSRTMIFMAAVHLLGGMALVGAGCLGALGTAMSGAFSALAGMVVLMVIAVVLMGQGGLLIAARGRLAAVVDTDEADQEHLLAALGLLRTFFVIEVLVGLLQLLNGLTRIGTSLWSMV